MSSRLPFLSLLCLTAVTPGPLAAAETSEPMQKAIQVVADLTLIDGACRGDVVNFGVAFRFARDNGVAEVSMMPTGTRRNEFEAALRSRRARFSTDELCGEIAANYAEALPGSISFPTATSH